MNSDEPMKKILIIDAQPEMRRNLTTILQLEKFQPLPAENGRVGIELAKKEKPDLILSEIVMPELDGLLLSVARQRQSPFRSSFLRLRVRSATFVPSMSLGADDYLTKPVAKTDLLGAIRSRLCSPPS